MRWYHGHGFVGINKVDLGGRGLVGLSRSVSLVGWESRCCCCRSTARRGHSATASHPRSYGRASPRRWQQPPRARTPGHRGHQHEKQRHAHARAHR